VVILTHPLADTMPLRSRIPISTVTHPHNSNISRLWARLTRPIMASFGFEASAVPYNFHSAPDAIRRHRPPTTVEGQEALPTNDSRGKRQHVSYKTWPRDWARSSCFSTVRGIRPRLLTFMSWSRGPLPNPCGFLRTSSASTRSLSPGW